MLCEIIAKLASPRRKTVITINLGARFTSSTLMIGLQEFERCDEFNKPLVVMINVTMDILMQQIPSHQIITSPECLLVGFHTTMLAAPNRNTKTGRKFQFVELEKNVHKYRIKMVKGIL